MAIFPKQGCNDAPHTSSQKKPQQAFSAIFRSAIFYRNSLTTVSRAAIRRATCALAPTLLGLTLCLTLSGCAQSNRPIQLLELPDTPSGSEVRRLSGNISEVSPPAIFLDLANLASDLHPQVKIVSPRPDQTFSETRLSAKIELRGLSIYKEEKTELGPHLKVILDNQPAQNIYELDQPIEFSNLAPGSHTLRVLSVLPWGESFKNEEAYAQTTFHIFAKAEENVPNPDLPLLTYSEPQGSFGAQPVLLDFYLSNAPLHLVASEDEEDNVRDWRIRCTINGQTFTFDRWQPIYLKGLEPGQNWVQLSLIDEQGNTIDNKFNSTVRVVNYEPDRKDSLAKLVRGELPIKQIGQIVIADYEPPAAIDKKTVEQAVEEVEPIGEPVPLADDEPTGVDNLEPVGELLKDRPAKEALEDEEFSQQAEDLNKADSLSTSDDVRADKENMAPGRELEIETVPETLDAPATEAEIDFSGLADTDKFEDFEDFERPDLEKLNFEESNPEEQGFEESVFEKSVFERSDLETLKGTEALESAEDALDAIEENLVETTTSADPAANVEPTMEPSAKPGFLERLKTQLQAFQAKQLQSQGDTLLPAKNPLIPVDGGIEVRESAGTKAAEFGEGSVRDSSAEGEDPEIFELEQKFDSKPGAADSTELNDIELNDIDSDLGEADPAKKGTL